MKFLKSFVFVAAMFAAILIVSCNKPVSSYSVTWMDEEGKLIKEEEYKEEKVPHLNYVKEETESAVYLFLGWSDKPGGEVIDPLPKVTGNATYYACVKVTHKYMIKFETSGGTKIKTQILPEGSEVLRPADPVLEGHHFTGWYLEPSFKTQAQWPVKLDSDLTLYAKYQEDEEAPTSIISWFDDEGSLLASEPVLKNTVPSRSFSKEETESAVYLFLGWSDKLGGDVIDPLPKVTRNASYYACVKVTHKYTVTFVTEEGSEVDPVTAVEGTIIQKPQNPTREGYHFAGWCYDADFTKEVKWPLSLTSSLTLYAKYNKQVPIKEYLGKMLSAFKNDPYSYLPDSMRIDCKERLVSKNQITYDYNNYVNVKDIKFGGYGEQWHMVLDNIKQSEVFYKVLALGEATINTSVIFFNNYLDNNPLDESGMEKDDAKYKAFLKFADNKLSYSLLLKSEITIPLIGELTPQIDVTYDIESEEKTVRIDLNENNALMYIIKANSYEFLIKYSISELTRVALFNIERFENDKVEGHIYEYLKAMDKDVINSCADFYIDKEYASVVGNKASGLFGFTGFINELYSVSSGNLLGYKIREEVASLKYHTLWFNLNDIGGIESIKAIPDPAAVSTNKNPHKIYVNNANDLFMPEYKTKLGIKTSRKFDIELRNQYFYEMDPTKDAKLIEHKTATPMMFIQDDESFADFVSDIKKTNNIKAKIKVKDKDLAKIREDYDTLIDVFIENKNKITSDVITSRLGEKIPLG